VSIENASKLCLKTDWSNGGSLPGSHAEPYGGRGAQHMIATDFPATPASFHLRICIPRQAFEDIATACCASQPQSNILAALHSCPFAISVVRPCHVAKPLFCLRALSILGSGTDQLRGTICNPSSANFEMLPV
jgi:hypothetical protein